MRYRKGIIFAALFASIILLSSLAYAFSLGDFFRNIFTGKVIDNSPLAIITSPKEGQTTTGLLVSFDASASTDDIKNDRSALCDSSTGKCWKDLIFSWSFDDGYVYTAKGSAGGAAFTRLFSSAGPHTVKLTVDDGNSASSVQVQFTIAGCQINLGGDYEFVPFGMCSPTALHYYCVNVSSIHFPGYYDTMAEHCEGFDGTNLTLDDCCPRGYYCKNAGPSIAGGGCVLRPNDCTTLSKTDCPKFGCVWIDDTTGCMGPANVSSCTDYGSQETCRNDVLGLGRPGGRGLGTDMCGKTIGNYVIPASSCNCTWDAGTGCRLYYGVNETLGGAGFISCKKRYISPGACDLNGKQTLRWVAECIGSAVDCASPEAAVQCSGGQRDVKCPTPFCIDSDGGKNYNIKGTATSNNQSVTDYCNSDGTVTESYCENNEIKIQVYSCPSGYKCSDGFCVNYCLNAKFKIETNQGYTCYNGSGIVLVQVERGTEDFAASGIQFVLGYQGSSESLTVKDGQNPSGGVIGQISSRGTLDIPGVNEARTYILKTTLQGVTQVGVAPIVKVNNQESLCSISSTANLLPCTDGTVNNECIDSDGGKNYNIKGTATSNNQSVTDYCNSDGTLTEKYCENNEIKADAYSCPSGYKCSEGACVNANQPNVTCNNHYQYKCYNNNVYWYDSCGKVQEKKEYCESGCNDTTCVAKGEGVKETVTCTFFNSSKEQKCYMARGQGEPEGLSCSGIGECRVEVHGYKGVDITWKSSCGGYQYTKVDGADETVLFDCSAGETNIEKIKGKGFSFAYWKCYDGTEEQSEDKTSCKSSETWQKYAKDFCKDHCSKDKKKCGVNSFSIWNECYTDETVETPTPTEGSLTEPAIVCKDSCPLDKKCYPFGLRKGGKFCSDEGKFVSEFVGNKDCENNFECESNVCVNGKCLSQGFIEKVLNWFKKMFGMKE